MKLPSPGTPTGELWIAPEYLILLDLRILFHLFAGVVC